VPEPPRRKVSAISCLLFLLVGAAAVIVALVLMGAIVRRLTHRQMRDTDRRHILLVIQRVVLWSGIVAVAAFAFASDLTSLATFFGLVAAGVGTRGSFDVHLYGNDGGGFGIGRTGLLVA
jgi:hypothetical protein